MPLGEWIVLLAGICMFYSPGVMERVAANRGLSCPECVGMVATLDHQQLGEKIWLQRADGVVEGPFLVVDCPKAQHRDELERRGLVAEVDWATAQRWRMTGPVACEQVVLKGQSLQSGRIAVQRIAIPPHLSRPEKYGG